MPVSKTANFSIGQIVKHRLLPIKGIVIDIDFYFLSFIDLNSASLFDQQQSPPWYHILVDNTVLRVYAIEADLIGCETEKIINHPAIGDYFSRPKNGHYFSKLLKH